MRTDMTKDQAQATREAAGHDAKVLARKSRYVLAAIYRSEGGLSDITGWTGADLLTSILNARYPVERQNEAIHVLHHAPGESWTACPWCHPHNGYQCECSEREGQS